MGDFDALKIWSLAQKHDHTDPEFVAALDVAEARADSPLSAVTIAKDIGDLGDALTYFPELAKHNLHLRAYEIANRAQPSHTELLAAAGELAEVRALVDAAQEQAEYLTLCGEGGDLLRNTLAALAPFARKAGV